MNDKTSDFKTATITFHAPQNTGAFLQAYALQYYIINNLHLPNEIINYQSDAQKKQYRIFGTKKGITGLFRDLCSCLHYLDLISKKKKYKALQDKHLKCTPECSEINDVLEQALHYDLLICGSDQIWNAELNDFSPAYYLPGFRNKISYACSLGKSVTDTTCHYLKKYLSEFVAVSVREGSSADFIEKEFGINAFHTIDPTLLVGREVYERIIREKCIAVPQNYIFLYTVKFQNYILELTEALSRKFNMPVFTILSTPSVHSGMRAEKHHIHVLYSGGPADFLTYIKNSSLVVSDSFHGIVFSVIFHKLFFRGQSLYDDMPVKDERLDSFLNMLGLTDRSITSKQREMTDIGEIDWKTVDDKLAIAAEQSGRWLECAVKSVLQKKTTTRVPHLIEDKHSCCGCGACYASCPTGSIIMIADEEGFLYPHVNPHTCIGCNKCVEVCSFKADQKSKGMS